MWEHVDWRSIAHWRKKNKSWNQDQAFLLWPTRSSNPPSPFPALVKGTVPRDFRLLVFYMNQFLPTPWVYCTIRAVSNFFENSRRYSQLVDTGGKWKKSSIRKILLILFGHLWEVEFNIHINFCLQVHFKVSAAWYCPHYLPPVSLTRVANLPLVSLMPVANCHRCRWHRRQICRRYRWHQ